MKPPLFDIPEKIIDSVDIETILETANDLIAMDLFGPPFETFSIRLSLVSSAKIGLAASGNKSKNSLDNIVDKVVSNWGNQTLTITYKDFTKKNDTLGCSLECHVTRKINDDVDFLSGIDDRTMRSMCNIICSVLIVLLATKNIERRVVKNDARANSKRARDDAKSFSTTTYLSIGRITETCRASGASLSGPVRPHLRRGHIRSQRYGEGFKEVRKIFIQPVFVNADKEWVEQQKTYKLTGSHNSAKSERLTASENGHIVQSVG